MPELSLVVYASVAQGNAVDEVTDWEKIISIDHRLSLACSIADGEDGGMVNYS